MKKMMTFAAVALGAAAAFAEPSWALLATEGAKGETTPNASAYQAYLCTASSAGTYFGGNTGYAGITAYLGGSAANYTAGVNALKGGADTTVLDSYGFLDGDYSFGAYFQPGTLDSQYVALVTYANGGDNYFRVFESTTDAQGGLTFNPVGPEVSGAAGAWTAAAVPEPTSGLLFLLGLASLALRRKRGEG